MTKISKLASYTLSIAMTLSLVLEAPGIAYAQEYAGTTAPVEDNNDIEEENINEENNSSAEGDNETGAEDNIEENNNNVENVENVKENEDAGEDNADDNDSDPVNETDAEDDQEDQPEQAVQEDEHVHSYSYEQVDEEKHLAVCLGCGENIEEPHSFTDGVCNLCSYAQELELDNADEECYIEAEKITALYFDIEDPSEYLFESSCGGGIAYAVESGDGTYDVYVNGAEVIEGDFGGLCNCSCVIFGDGTYTFAGGRYFAGLGSSVGDALVDFTDASLVFESESNLFSGSSVSEIYLPYSLSATETVSLDKEYDGFSNSEEYAGVYSVLCNASTDVVFFRLPGSGSKASPSGSVLIWTDEDGTQYLNTDAISITDLSEAQDEGVLGYTFDTDGDEEYDLLVVTSDSEDNVLNYFNTYNTFHSFQSNTKRIVFRDKIIINSCYNLFSNFKMLTDIINLSNLNIDNGETSMVQMFYNCQSLTELDLSNFNTSNVTNMSQMFYNCKALESIIGITSWNLNSVINTSSMFHNCTKLDNINTSNWHCCKLTQAQSMFYWCESLTEIDLSNWGAPLINASGMFSNCCNLQSINGMNLLNVSETCATESMFYCCKSLTEIDLQNFKQIKSDCFWGCNALYSLKNMDNITFIADHSFSQFHAYNAIITLTNIYNTTNEVVLNYNWQSDSRVIDSLIYTDEDGTEYYASQAEKIIDFSNDYKLGIIGYIFNIDNDPSEQFLVMCSTSENNICTKSCISNSPQQMYLNSSTSIKKVIIKDKMKLSDAENFFYNMSQVTEFVGLENFDISDVTSLNSMFYNCRSIKQLDLSTWNTSNITNMNQTFSNCLALESFDFSSCDLSNVTDTYRTFYSCSSLKSLDLGNIKTIDYWFARDCPVLTSISGLDNVTSISSTAFYRTATKEVPLLYTDINGCENEVVLNYNWEADNRTIACDSFTIVMPAKIEAPVVVPSEGAAYYGATVNGNVSYKLGSGKKLCVDAVDSFSLVNENNEALTASVTQSDSEFSSDTGTLNSDGDYEDSFTIAIKITGDKLDYNTVYSGKMGFTVSIEDS